jgi:hypothetical protein
MASFAFHVLVVQRLDRTGALYQVFAGDGWQVKSLITLLFFTGAAALGLKLYRLIVEFGAIERFKTSTSTAEIGSAMSAERLMDELNGAPSALQNRRLLKRLKVALEQLQHVSPTDSLAAHLHQLAAADRHAMQAEYAAPRLTAIAISVVGLLGALGRGSAALASLAAGGDQAMPSVVSSAHVAIDMLAAAVAASVLLVFAKLGVQRLECRLLDAVDAAVSGHLLGRVFHPTAVGDTHAASVVRLCEKLLETVHAAVAQHDAALTKAIGTTTRRWEEAASTASALMHRTVGDALAAGLKDHAEALNRGVAKHTQDLEGVLIRHAQILSDNIDQHTGALADALEHHTAVITQTETNLAAENRHHLAELEGALGEAVLIASTRQEKLIKQSEDLLREMQSSLVEAAGISVAQQEQLIRQGDVMLRVVEATAHVRKLEEALNENLTALAASHRFEETVVGLSAALQLLSTKLGRQLVLRDDVTRESTPPASQAA